MKFAAISMNGKTADVESHMLYARKCIEEAVTAGAEFIVLPEFFNTGFGIHEKMVRAIQQAENTTEILKSWSAELQVIISGSYLQYHEKTKEVHNAFIIVFPDGTVFQHNKDIPTAVEALYYNYGDNIRVFKTSVGRIGIAMCWEQIRYQTLREMMGKVDYVIAGSCWWNFSEEDAKAMYQNSHAANAAMAEKAPVQMAKILCVPVIHASHICEYESLAIGKKKEKCMRKIEGNTMIVDENGTVLKSCDKASKQPFVIANVEKGKGANIKLPWYQYWIPKMSWKLKMAFWYSTHVCHKKYREYIRGAGKI